MKIRKFRLLLVAVVLILAALACSIPQLDTFVSQESVGKDATEVITPEVVVQDDPNSEPQSTTLIIPDEVLLEDTLVDLYSRVSPGVVSIQIFSDLGTGYGSGFVVDKEGYIVTNYHVVEQAGDIEVQFPSGLKVFGELVGVDLDSDLAVVRVDVDPDELYPLTLGDSSQVRVGQSVIAIGNPYGLTGTMTTGIVSARGRTLESIRQTESGQYFSAGDLIQTDATINPGNSGGPLLNLNGEVIGINRAIRTSGTTITGEAVNSGIGFAVSSNILQLVLPALEAGETYGYPYLGLSAIPSLSLTESDFLGLSQANGAYVVEVVPDGPADQAGIQAGSQPTEVQGLYGGGDMIIGVDSIEIHHFSELLSYMMLNKKPGDQMVIAVLRDGEELDFNVTLGERPSNGF